MLYLCRSYGTELHLDGVFHRGVRDSTGKAGVHGRLRGIPGDDGLYILVVENGL